MAHDRAQSLLLPQPGFIPPQPGLGTVPSVTRGFRDSAANFPYPKFAPIILPPGAYFDQRQSNCPPGPPVRPAHTGTGSTETPPEQDHQIITYDDLEKLLPKPKPTGRIEVGLLPDGSAYAPKTGENYLLFPSKSSYILYFTHHYFSRENLSRDVPLLSRMVNRLILPLDKLIKAPRLVALNTTQEEVEQALVKSKIVCLEDMGNGIRGVRRIDGFPAISSPNETTSTRSVTMTGTDSMVNSITTAGNGLSQTFQPAPTSTQSADVTNEDERMLAASLADISFTTKSNTLPGYSYPPLEQPTGQTNALVSPNLNSASVSRLSPNQPITCSATQSSTHPSTIVGQASTTYENTTTSPAVSNSAVCSSRSTSAIWSQPSTFALSPNNRSSLLGVNASQQPLDSPSITHTSHSSSILGFPSRPPYGPGMPTGNLQPPDLQPISVLPMRQQAALPQYLLGQTAHGSGAYPSSLFCQTCYSKSPMNMAFAAAMSNPAHQQLPQAHLTPNPQFPGQFFHGQPGQVPPLNAHQTNVALATATSYQAAVAALAAAAQQQVAPAYFNTPITPNMHSQVQHVQQAVQSPLPVYYPAQLSLPAHFQRHPLPRFSHGSVYPLQSYQQPNPNTAHHNPVQQSSEMSGTFGKEGSGFSAMGNTPQAATSIAYPFLLQPHVHLHHASQPSPHNPNLVAAAAAGLHIQYPQQMTPRQPPVNTYNLIPPGLTVVSSPVSAPGQTQTINEDGNPPVASEYQEKIQPVAVPDAQSVEVAPLAYNNGISVQGPGPTSVSSTRASPISSGDKNCEPSVKQTVDVSEAVVQSAGVVQTELAVHKPGSPEDSEDSASSGIGEMNSAGSSGPVDTRTSSSLTLTDQLKVDSVTSSTCELSSYRHQPRSSRTKDVERNP